VLASEKLAIAAHLHVLLRRKVGRVTDTEWMATNTDYAAEIIRIARASALQDGHTDLAEWAEKLELAMKVAPPQNLAQKIFSTASPAVSTPPSRPKDPAEVVPDGGGLSRYIRGIR
jgi:hypothetical protein